MHIDDFDIDLFLNEYWQKKPLMIRNPWAKWTNPMDADELAGLACEEGVESRLVLQAGETWKLTHGPFAADQFDPLANGPGTLLVQAVDHFVPEVAALIEPFRFIPDWRIDDVMVSYASDGGGVGPHFDQYDVFLIQGSGRRRWQVGAYCDDDSELLPHDDLRLLARFAMVEEWICEPGDILYVPPGISHNGVAIGDGCMTYSVGFRAPSRAELIGHWCDDLLSEMPDDDRYTDPPLRKPENPGEISAEALERLHGMILDRLGDRQAFARWFGQYGSAPKYSDMDWRPDEPVEMEAISRMLVDAVPLCRNPASRFSFVRQGEGRLMLFVDGEVYDCSGATAVLAEEICRGRDVISTSGASENPAIVELVQILVNRGSLAFDREE